MGWKLDLSGLTDDEADHVLKVVHRDMKLRKKDEDRLSDLKNELEEEGVRCLLLVKQHGFNKQCCIRCCGPFSLFFKMRRICLDCCYNVCNACCTYSQHENGYVCVFCNKNRLLRAMSLEWYYNNFKSRFKRFGSAKVLKTLFKKQIINRETLVMLPEVSAPEGNNDNDGSECGHESAFSKQSESHSIAETLNVALHVAEEAIEDAITKAESYRDSLEKQNEARYLRDHREELIEELASTIVQKRSLSALSLMSDESPDNIPEADKVLDTGKPEPNLDIYTSLRRESRTTILGWKNVDRLDISSASSVLQSPDGNWIALQTSQHSRPSLLTKRKSLVFSVLEKESGVVSAYDEMGSDSEDGRETDSWGPALLQFHLSEETQSSDCQHDTQHYPPITSPSLDHFSNTETPNSDNENSIAPSTQKHIPLYNFSQRTKVSPELYLRCIPDEPYRFAAKLLHSPNLGAVDVNFNPQVVGSSRDGKAEQIQMLHKKRNIHESAEQSCVHNPLYIGENGRRLSNTMMMKQQDNQEIPLPLPAAVYKLPDTVTPPPHLMSTAMTSEFVQNTVTSNPVLPILLMHNTLDYKLRSKLSELVDRISKEDLISSNNEPIQEIINQQQDGEREKESDGVRQRVIKNETPNQSNGKIETERNKIKMKQSSKRTIEQQISSECDQSGVMKLRSRERDRKREGNSELERQMEKYQKLERRRQVLRIRQVRQLEIETDNESKAENVKSTEIEPYTIAQVNEFNMTRDLQESETQSVEKEHSDKEHYLTVLKENRDLQQRNKSKRGFEERTEAETHRTLPDLQEQMFLTENYSAISLCSITTDVLKVLNATEKIIGGPEGNGHNPDETLSSGPNSENLDKRLTKMEENVYLAAGTVYGLEGELSDLEECAQSISSSTTETELAVLEDQVANAAVQVQHSELQISDIEARISALKNAGLNLTVCSRFPRFKRRKLPAPPAIEKSEVHSQDLHPWK